MPEKTTFTALTGVEVATLYAPYGPGECAERLRDRLDRAEIGGIVGSVTARSVKLRFMPGGPEAHNSWFAMLSGSLTPHGDGTRIDCHLGVSRALVIFVAGLALCAWIMFAPAIVVDPAAAIVPLGFSLILAGMHALGSGVARRRSRTLLYFLSSAVGGGERHADRAAAIEDLWRNA